MPLLKNSIGKKGAINAYAQLDKIVVVLKPINVSEYFDDIFLILSS